jgi:tetratricopeptide (TPR) repeat protein
VTRRALALLGVILFLGVVAIPAPASAEPKPKNEGPPPPTKPKIMISSPGGGVVAIPPGDEDSDSEEADTDSLLGGLPRTYQMLVRRFQTMSPADTMGDGAYRLAETAFTSGKFEDAGKAYFEFARRYPRNLLVNDALSTMLLIKEARDFEDQPLLLYARGRAYRNAGQPDSAVAVLTRAAERFPGAKVRGHVRLMLAEMAQERGDHAHALQWAVAAADTAAKSRLTPYALKIAAESSLALGEPPQRALAYYKTILEKYPQSPITPEARSRALAIRKRMPQ